jgi:hypothetical protein
MGMRINLFFFFFFFTLKTVALGGVEKVTVRVVKCTVVVFDGGHYRWNAHIGFVTQ